MSLFSKQLSYGQLGESRIANYFKARGYNIMPVYEVEINSGKGPRLFTSSGPLIAPDIFIFKADRALWIEAKHKTAFAWYRKKNVWTTGIDIRHYKDYCKIAEFSPYPVMLMFLHEGGQAKDSPPDSPSGLFGENIKKLQKCESHRWESPGFNMVFWEKDVLKKYAELSEV